TSIPYTFESKIINKDEELRIGKEMYAMLNQDQRSAADKILAAHHKQSTTASCFFIDGPGGPDEEEFSKWLIKLGNSELPSNEYDEVELPSSCMLDGNFGRRDIWPEHFHR
ncbi:unnamed protein product, partial [Rotaria sp. Silwood1]